MVANHTEEPTRAVRDAPACIFVLNALLGLGREFVVPSRPCPETFDPEALRQLGGEPVAPRRLFRATFDRPEMEVE
jgi:hypothetical protein